MNAFQKMMYHRSASIWGCYKWNIDLVQYRRCRKLHI